MKKPLTYALALLALSSAAHAWADENALNLPLSGPLTYTDLIVPGGVASLNSAFSMRYVRPVLAGVLFRGGGLAGVEAPMNSTELHALCEAGFSAVDYAYNGQAPETISCGSHSYVYRTVPYVLSQASVFLTDVYNAITQPDKGPVMVHCWNGWHESGMLSAFALRQFCGWSGAQASAYWIKNIGDTMGPQYYGVTAGIQAFKPVPGLEISAEQSAAICPTDVPN